MTTHQALARSFTDRKAPHLAIEQHQAAAELAAMCAHPRITADISWLSAALLADSCGEVAAFEQAVKELDGGCRALSGYMQSLLVRWVKPRRQAGVPGEALAPSILRTAQDQGGPVVGQVIDALL